MSTHGLGGRIWRRISSAVALAVCLGQSVFLLSCANGTAPDNHRVLIPLVPTVFATGQASHTVAGIITAASSSQLTVNAGSGCGMLHVSIGSHTTIDRNDLPLSSGVYATATGSGDCSNSLQATLVVLSSSLTTLTAVVTGLSDSGFTINPGSPCGRVPITVNAQTMIYNNGLAVAPGQVLQVTGPGS